MKPFLTTQYNAHCHFCTKPSKTQIVHPFLGYHFCTCTVCHNTIQELCPYYPETHTKKQLAQFFHQLTTTGIPAHTDPCAWEIDMIKLPCSNINMQDWLDNQ